MSLRQGHNVAKVVLSSVADPDPHLKIHEVNTELEDQKDTFVLLKIRCCLLIFNDFLMSFLKI